MGVGARLVVTGSVIVNHWLELTGMQEPLLFFVSDWRCSYGCHKFPNGLIGQRGLGLGLGEGQESGCL